MKLRISRKKRTIAQIFYYGGLAVLLLSIPACAFRPDAGVACMMAGAVAVLAGALWIDCHYCCPVCGKRLMGRGWEALTLTPYRHCPNCGWAVDIEYTD